MGIWESAMGELTRTFFNRPFPLCISLKLSTYRGTEVLTTEVGTGQISFYMKLKQFDGSKVSKLLSLRDYCDA